MYRSHYQLILKPFQLNTDPKFLWLGEKHKEALAILKYGVIDQKGFLLVSGDVGTGKTTLINALLENIGEDTLVATIRDPALNLIEFYNLIALSFDIPEKFSSKIEFLSYFKEFLKQKYSENKRVLLIIDEVHSLSRDLLEHIRLLSNIELPEEKLINIFFVGQNEIHQTLALPECRALRQRISLVYHIDPLSNHETGMYIKHRLKVAGTKQDIFTPEAIREIHKFSMGYPRMINTLCDHALLTGYVRDLTTISPSIINECAHQFMALAGYPEGEPSATLPNRQPLPPSQSEPSPVKNDRLILVSPPEQNVSSMIASSQADYPGKRVKGAQNSRYADLLGEYHPGILITFLGKTKKHLVDSVVKNANKRPRVWMSAAFLVFIALCLAMFYPTTPTHTETPTAPISKAPLPAPSPDISEAPAITHKPRIITPSTLNMTVMEQAKRALDNRDFSRSASLYRQVAQRNPEDLPIIKMDYSKALQGQAKRMMNKEPGEALRLLAEAVEIDPQNAEAHFDLGRLHTNTHDFPLAIHAYQNAANLGYRPPETFYNLGFIYASIHQYELAEQMLTHVVDLNPPYIDKALYNLAVVQYKQGKKQECLESLEKALINNPDNPRAKQYLKTLKADKDAEWLSVARNKE